MAAKEFKQEVVLVNKFEYKTGYIWQIDCKVKNLKIEDIMLKFEFDNVQYIGNEREQIAKIDSVRDYAVIVTIPEIVYHEGKKFRVVSVGTSAFAHCKRLASVTLPDSVTEILDSAFMGCVSLKSFTVPKKVSSISHSAFFMCSSLQSIEVASGNEYFLSIDGVLYNKSQSSLLLCPIKKTSITIPKTVEKIDFSCWSGLNHLKKVEVSEKNKCFSSIDGVLYNYSQTTLLKCLVHSAKVKIPNGVKTIKSNACNYSELHSVIIPPSVETIAGKAFDWKNIKEIVCLSKQPPVIDKADFFQDQYEWSDEFETDAVLKVPQASVNTYKKSDWGLYFKDIIPSPKVKLTSIDMSKQKEGAREDKSKKNFSRWLKGVFGN